MMIMLCIIIMALPGKSFTIAHPLIRPGKSFTKYLISYISSLYYWCEERIETIGN
jgi:hypothetical protein